MHPKKELHKHNIKKNMFLENSINHMYTLIDNRQHMTKHKRVFFSFGFWFFELDDGDDDNNNNNTTASVITAQPMTVLCSFDERKFRASRLPTLQTLYFITVSTRYTCCTFSCTIGVTVLNQQRSGCMHIISKFQKYVPCKF